ncbi:MAG: hypothetical protein KGQ45_09215, partial [Burkholderiales bacterium]|nr:hypothetical protein [Burkholderiales bacterium]
MKLLTLFLQRICNVERIGSVGGAVWPSLSFSLSVSAAPDRLLEQRLVDFHERLRARARLADRGSRFR